ncbi:hypothetical protein SETIT_5G236300v2 [Setaria italica]|uniref:Uncharacterized protein n=1 Tax=Setaria italica TaxID=4555 RepID=A0A368R8B4_SETIT|nr:hypothetical protein SETIT_5G236300v2 [Setaria italica]
MRLSAGTTSQLLYPASSPCCARTQCRAPSARRGPHVAPPTGAAATHNSTAGALRRGGHGGAGRGRGGDEPTTPLDLPHPPSPPASFIAVTDLPPLVPQAGDARWSTLEAIAAPPPVDEPTATMTTALLLPSPYLEAASPSPPVHITAVGMASSGNDLGLQQLANNSKYCPHAPTSILFLPTPQ